MDVRTEVEKTVTITMTMNIREVAPFYEAVSSVLNMLPSNAGAPYDNVYELRNALLSVREGL